MHFRPVFLRKKGGYTNKQNGAFGNVPVGSLHRHTGRRRHSLLAVDKLSLEMRVFLQLLSEWGYHVRAVAVPHSFQVIWVFFLVHRIYEGESYLLCIPSKDSRQWTFGLAPVAGSRGKFDGTPAPGSQGSPRDPPVRVWKTMFFFSITSIPCA